MTATTQAPQADTTPSAQVETRDFQAQTQKLLDLMIHSVYSHKEVFLRELISNASDALDKVRFLALTDEELAKGDHDYRIELVPDMMNRTLTVRDNGVGMSYDEVIANIGTIARSGSQAFVESLAAGEGSPDLIGRFGVGFYSAFMVADRVELTTCKHGEANAVRWSSTGDGTYTIERLPPTDRGTSVKLTLKALAEKDSAADQDDDGEGGSAPSDDQDFVQEWVLREVVKKHSDFVAFPIVMDVVRHEAERDEEGKVVENGKVTKKTERVTLNSMKALWTRPKGEIEDSEYDDFYRHVTRDWGKPFDRLHVQVEGMQEYTALMYLPERAPFDLYTRESRRGLQLYVKHVFIMDECRELMPEYLRFVRGLVDSPDLPLNVSREMVQYDRIIGSMRKTLTRKWLSHFADMLKSDRERYEKFWTEFGAALKEGFHYDPRHKDKLSKLLLLRSTHGDGWTTLDEYIARAPEGQDKIYTLSGDKLEALRGSPQLEIFAAKGVEVLLFADPVDEIMLGAIDEYEGKALQSASRGEVDLSGIGKKADDAEASKEGDEDAKDEDKKDDHALAPLLAALGRHLSDDVESVRISTRLTDSAACLVTPEGGMSPQIERMMKAMGQDLPAQKRVLEVNPTHPLLKKLGNVYAADPDDARVADYGHLLFDQAVLSEGGQPKNPARFARKLAEVMAAAL